MLRILLTITAILTAFGVRAEVASETIYFIQPDGETFLLQRAMRTDNRSQRFLLDKSISEDDIRHVSPADYDWESQKNLNQMTFSSGNFTLIYPGRFSAAELTKSGTRHTFESWNGKRSGDHYGIWYSAGNFDEFVYSWIFPSNILPLSYQSNRRGEWVRRGNAISFNATDVNNLTFSISYEVTPVAVVAENAPDVAAARNCPPPPEPVTCPELSCPEQSCPETVCPEPEPVVCPEIQCPAAEKIFVEVPSAAAPCEQQPRTGLTSLSSDSDRDGVPDASDMCPNTLPSARVDRAGCVIDNDRDGVPDGIDLCPSTPEGTIVGTDGCHRKH